MLSLLALVASGQAADPPLPVIPGRTTNVVVNFLAKGDGSTDNAGSINAAITAINSAGGGTVEIPANGTLSTYLCGPLTMKSSVNLQIDTNATLKMLPMSTWPNASTPFILGSSLTDVEITGSGKLDGQGTNWWYPLASTRPNFVQFDHCTRVLIQGVTLQNPPTFTIYLKNSDTSVTVQGITINTPYDSHNTDAFDISSTNVLIRNSHISTGDDDVEIGGSGAAATDITISNCWFGTGHGVSIGSYTQGGVNNLTVSNCWWTGTEYGIKMKTDRDRGGSIQNLKYCDLTMTNVNFPFAFYEFYNSMGSPSKNITNAPAGVAADPGQTITSTTPIFRNVAISNLIAVGNSGVQGPGNVAGIIFGVPEMPITNVTLCRVNIQGRTSDGTVCLYNVRGIQFIDCNLTAPTSGTNTLTLYNAQFSVTNSAPNTNTITITGLGSPSNSVLSLINGQVETGDAIFGANPLLTLADSTLTVSNNASLGGTSKLNYGLGTNATTTAVTGNLTLGGTLNVADGGGFTNTTYTLFTYNGTLTYGGLTVGTTPNSSFTYTVSTNTHGQVNLTVASSCSVGAAGSISGSTSVNAGVNGVAYSIASVSGATTYTWTVPSGASIASGQGTTSITVNYSCSAVGGSVHVTPGNANGCSGTAGSLSITVTSVGAAGSISGSSSVNAGASGVTYSISSVGGANTYTWTVPSGASIASGQGTTSITVNYSCSATSGNVTVTPSNGSCSGAFSSLSVTVTAVGAAGSISGLSAVCAGQSGVSYSISSVSGATTYTWGAPSGATITSGQGSTSITVNWGSIAGSVMVTPSGANGCSGNNSGLSVAINPAPGIVSDPSPQVTCDGGSASFTVSASGAGLSYQWQKNGVNIVSDGGTVSGSATAMLTLTGVSTGDSGASFDCVVSGTCSPPSTSGGATLTVNANPATFNVTGGGSSCAAGGGVTVGLDGSESNADYQLELNGNPAGTPVAGTGSAISFTNETAVGTYTVIASNVTSGCAAMMNGSASVTPGDPFTCWQLQYFGCTNLAICPQAAATADPDGDGQNNMAEFLAGTDPTNSASALRIISTVAQGANVNITWNTAGGHTNIVQVTSGDGSGGYTTNNFVDIPSSQTILPGSGGDIPTNYLDLGGATNVPSRYYRIRLVP